jgi:ribonuclease Z
VKRTFRPELINGPRGDPLVLVRVRWSGRRLLLDLGEAGLLATRDALRVSDVFLSHAHMDHLIGFDHLLRLHLGRPTRLRLYGPEGTGARIEAKLGGYTWNLVGDYTFTLEVWDLLEDRMEGRLFHASNGFGREPLETQPLAGGLILDEEPLSVRVGALDHGIPSLGYRIEEPERLNVDAGALERWKLKPGPWVACLKERVRAGAPPDEPVVADTPRGDPLEWTMERASRELLHRAPGHALAYASDLAYTEENALTIERLAHGADPFLCEATFRESEAEEAAARHHLTARQAGLLARRAGAHRLVLFHLSPRYAGSEEEHLREAAEAFEGPVSLA